MTYTIIESGYNSTIGKTIDRDIQTLTEARRLAYKTIKNSKTPIRSVKIFDDSTAKYVTFMPTNQRLKSTMGEEIAEVIMHHAGFFEGVVFYYPDYSSQYYKKSNAKYHKYVLNKDGSLGKGMW